MEPKHSSSYGSRLPGELWMSIFKCFHPIYDDLFTVAKVCKKWRNLILLDPDPLLWGKIELQNLRTCYTDSVSLKRFSYILAKLGKTVRVLKLHRCHRYFMEILKLNSRNLSSLQSLQITGMNWERAVLEDLPSFKALQIISLEGSIGENDIEFNSEDLKKLVDTFPRLKQLNLKYSIVKTETLTTLQDLVVSPYSQSITSLHLERTRIAPFELNEIVCGLKGLKKFAYGNDQIYGLPSIQSFTLCSKSLVEVSLFQIGDLSEFSLHMPALQKLTVNISTSIQVLEINAPSLRVLHLLHCMELRKLRRLTASSLQDLKLCRCLSLPLAELIGLLAKNPDIKTMELELMTPSLRLDHHCNPSLEKLAVLDSSDLLMSVDISCPKLKSFRFKKSFVRPSLVKSIRVNSEDLEELILQGVSHLRKAIINTNKLISIEIDFDRHMGLIKPTAFTKLLMPSQKPVRALKLKNCNIRSMNVHNCEVECLELESCNLDMFCDDLLSCCTGVRALTLRQCYGPCQLSLSNPYVKEVFVISCSPTIMDHINITCDALEQISIHGCVFLPNQKEIEETANQLKQLCPMLRSVRFSNYN